MDRNSKYHVARKFMPPMSEGVNFKDNYKSNLVEVKEKGKTIYMTPEAYERKYGKKSI